MYTGNNISASSITGHHGSIAATGDPRRCHGAAGKARVAFRRDQLLDSIKHTYPLHIACADYIDHDPQRKRRRAIIVERSSHQRRLVPPPEYFPRLREFATGTAS